MKLHVIGGSSHPEFTKSICENLNITETPRTIQTFSNDNLFVSIDEPVRGDDVFVIQTQAPPVDKNLMELFCLIRALRDANARRITAVLPYMPYIRSDKRDQPRICITARLVADLLQTAGAQRVIVMDMHAPQIQGFFSIKCDHLIAAPEIIKHFTANWNLADYVLVAGDAGAAKMQKDYADGLHLPVAIMDKRRESNDETVKIKGVIGDVKNKKVLLIDDETQSGGTLIKDAEFLLNEAGAKSVDACIVHPALGPNAAEKLNASAINRFVSTNSIPPTTKNLKNYEIVSVTKKFAEAIRRIHEDESIRSLNVV
jgi:ribose-phosphate pyrophosphokinase